ncbi:proteasome subunit beta type-3-A [Tanacetum coccineum]
MDITVVTLVGEQMSPWKGNLPSHQRLVFRHKLYQLREEKDMKPETFSSLISAVLYEKRFGPYFCQPMIAGLGDDDKPPLEQSKSASYAFLFVVHVWESSSLKVMGIILFEST